MAINAAGVANPADYVLGRGVVMIAKLDADGNPGPFRDLGNAPSFTVTGTAQTIEHQSSRHALALIDRRIVTSQALTCGFELDEVQNFENLADWLLGEADTLTNGAVAGNAAAIQTLHGIPDGEISAWLGRHQLLYSDASLRCYSVLAADVVVTTTETVPVTLVLGTDYELDLENGSIFYIADSAKLATAMGTADGVKIKVTANGAAPATVDRARAFSSSSLEVAVRFVLENAADNANLSEILMPKVTLSSDGDLSLIGKDFATMKFSGSLSPGDVGSRHEGEFLIIVDGEGS